MNTSINQKRFLIIWVLLNSFALFVNLADFEGKIYESHPNPYDYYAKLNSKHYDTLKKSVAFDSIKKLILTAKSGQSIDLSKSQSDVQFTGSNYRDTSITIRLFTTSKDNSDFWPFTKYYTVEPPILNDIPTTDIYFNGIFNSYGIPEYIFYMFLGFGIVYLPKLWGNKERNTDIS